MKEKNIFFVIIKKGDMLKKIKIGQVALPIILLVSGIIIETALGGTMVAFLLSDSGWGERLSSQAFAAAESGIQDAFLKIAGNKDYCLTNPFGYPCGEFYSFLVGNGSAKISISVDISNENKYKIISIGNALNRQRKLEAVLATDRITGKVNLESIKEAE